MHEYATMNYIDDPLITLNDIHTPLNKNKNPVTGEKCRELFQGANSDSINSDSANPDKFIQLFYGTLSIFGLYLLYKFMEKNKNITIK